MDNNTRQVTIDAEELRHLIDRVNDVLVERRQRIEAMESVIEAKVCEINGLKRDVSGMTEEIKRLNGVVVERRRCSSNALSTVRGLRKTLAARDEHIKELNEALTLRSETITELGERLVDSAGRFREASTSIDNQQRYIAELEKRLKTSDDNYRAAMKRVDELKAQEETPFSKNFKPGPVAAVPSSVPELEYLRRDNQELIRLLSNAQDTIDWLVKRNV